jgi:VanZ family protein
MPELIVVVGVLGLLIAEMFRSGRGRAISATTRIARALPFAVASALSLWVVGQAPDGRKPFQVDLSLAAEDLARSMTKVPHFRSIAILFLMAALAVGSRRLLLALGLTMLVGLGWEAAETTVIGRHARLADLAPNLAAGAASLVTVLVVRWGVVSLLAWRRRGSPGDEATIEEG